GAIASNRETTGTGWTKRNRGRGHPRARLRRRRIAARRRPQNPRGSREKGSSDKGFRTKCIRRGDRPLFSSPGAQIPRDRSRSPDVPGAGSEPLGRTGTRFTSHKYYRITIKVLWNPR